MLAVAFYNPIGEWEYRVWIDLVKGFGIEHLMVVDTSGRKEWMFHTIQDPEVETHYLRSSEGAKGLLPGTTMVYMESSEFLRDKGIPYSDLRDFEHPGDTTYVFGPILDQYESLDSANAWVSVRTRERLWSPLTAGIVLYDRMVKNNSCR